MLFQLADHRAVRGTDDRDDGAVYGEIRDHLVQLIEQRSAQGGPVSA